MTEVFTAGDIVQNVGMRARVQENGARATNCIVHDMSAGEEMP